LYQAKIKMQLFYFLLFLLPLSFCQPNVIVMNQPGLFPEGIEYSPTLGFLVSSTSLGTVYRVNDSGALTPLVQNSSVLVGSIGIQVDSNRNELLICNSNTSVFSGNTQGFLAGFVRANLTSGRIINALNLSSFPTAGRHFANDVIMDKDGNAYVTDSFGLQVWKITPSGNASVFSADPRFEFLNGIEIFNASFLIVSSAGMAGKLYKIPVSNGSDIKEMNCPTIRADGLVFHPNGHLIAVDSNSTVVELASSDNWDSCTIVSQTYTGYEGATTATIRGNDVWVDHAHFFANPPPTAFEIVKIVLPTGTTGAMNATTGAAMNATTGAAMNATTGADTNATTGASQTSGTDAATTMASTVPMTTGAPATTAVMPSMTTGSNADSSVAALAYSFVLLLACTTFAL